MSTDSLVEHLTIKSQLNSPNADVHDVLIYSLIGKT